jgi:hypothetical protein
VGSGLLPVGSAHVRLQAAWLGVVGLGGSATRGAVPQRLGEGLVGLTLQGLREEFGAQEVAQWADELLQVVEAGAPGGPWGP